MTFFQMDTTNPIPICPLADLPYVDKSWEISDDFGNQKVNE